MDTAAAGAKPTGAPPRGGLTADKVGVSAGTGVIARDQPAPGVATGTLHLVTDLGVKYPLPSADVAAKR